MARSNERMPASTWATGIPAWAAAKAPDRVEFVSPYTRTRSGRSPSSSGSSAASIRAVCDAFVPPWMPSSRSGGGTLELLDEDPRQFVVVVLAGVDEHLVVSLAQTARDGGRLHELGPVANDGEYPRTSAARVTKDRR